MPDDRDDSSQIDPQEAVRMLDDARSRLRTAIWALHGMHQDLSALSVDDLADIEHLLTEILDSALTPCFETLSQMVGASSGGAVTTH
jgi:muconolactone delta-isomerase